MEQPTDRLGLACKKRARNPLFTIGAVVCIVLAISLTVAGLLTGRPNGAGLLILPALGYLAITRPATENDQIWPRSWGVAALIFVSSLLVVAALSFAVATIARG